MSLKLKLLLPVSLIFTQILTANSQQPIATTKSYFLEAQEFLKSFYPPLTGHGYIMSVETFHHYDERADYTTWFDISVGKGRKNFVVNYIGGYTGTKPPENYQPGPIYAEQLLDCHFEFDKQGRLLRFDAHGSSVGGVSDDVFAKVSDEVSKHPKMTDDDVNRALVQAGVKYGPWNKDEFIKSLPLAKLEPFLGKLSVTSVEFTGRDEGHFVPAGWATWKVRAEAKPSGLTYDMTFESFRGDLSSIVTVPWPPKTASQDSPK